MATDRRAILAAWRSATWARLTLRNRGDIERRQARLWRDMEGVVARTPALAKLAGRPLSELPIVEPAEIRAGFESWNSLGVTREAAIAGASDAEKGGSGEVAPGVFAGWSTGTSVTRGFFLTSAAERARYLGQALAKLIPVRDLLRGAKIALVLRADNELYRDVEKAGRFSFSFFGLDMEPAKRTEALSRLQPDYLIAPAHVLAELASTASHKRFGLRSLRRVFWGAEPMGVAEREWIASRLGVWPDPIYQATEGFLAAPCRFGTLHLNEDAMVIELESVAGTAVFRPVVTDLFRTSQPMVRVRLDDLIEPVAAHCRCGSPLRVIRPVEGRAADLWRWPERTVRPAEVWAVMESSLGPDAGWIAEASADGVKIQGAGLNEEAVRKAMAALVGGHPVHFANDLGSTGFPKRRRVRWRG